MRQGEGTWEGQTNGQTPSLCQFLYRWGVYGFYQRYWRHIVAIYLTILSVAVIWHFIDAIRFRCNEEPFLRMVGLTAIQGVEMLHAQLRSKLMQTREHRHVVSIMEWLDRWRLSISQYGVTYDDIMKAICTLFCWTMTMATVVTLTFIISFIHSKLLLFGDVIPDEQSTFPSEFTSTGVNVPDDHDQCNDKSFGFETIPMTTVAMEPVYYDAMLNSVTLEGNLICQSQCFASDILRFAF